MNTPSQNRQKYSFSKWIKGQHGDRWQAVVVDSTSTINLSNVGLCSKEEYKTWKWDATTRYYTSYTKMMLQGTMTEWGSLCPDPAGSWMTVRPPVHRKETQTAVVWSCLPFIRSGQNHHARHSETGKKTRQTEEVVGRQHQGMDRPGVWQVPECSGEQGKIEKIGRKIICSAPTTLMVMG